LSKLEGERRRAQDFRPGAPETIEDERERDLIREGAEWANGCSYTDDGPPFEITESGEVFCTRDGKPVTHYHQTLAEVWYLEFRDEGHNPRGLTHDEEAHACYTPETDELVFSRDWCLLPNFNWAQGDDRAYPQGITHDKQP